MNQGTRTTNSTKTGLGVVLFAVALVLVYIAVRPSPSSPQTPGQPQSPSAETAPATETIILLEGGQKLVWPLDDAPQTEGAMFLETVKKFAQEGSTVTITQCKPSPAILHIKKGQEFQVKNEGDSDAIIVIWSGVRRHIVAAKKTITLKLDLTGVIGYHCEGIPGAVYTKGIFYVTE